MASGLIDKRKRSREDDVSCDSDTPLSKRINNLHLSNFEEVPQYNPHLPTNNNSHHHHHSNNHHLPHHLAKELMHHQQHSTSVMKTVVIGNEEHDESMYNPELNESENPFYYIKNKLLHDLHLERLKRCTV
ncbi:histone-lysine N-methyltransferase set1 [Stomoxys calcitrans]|uniref:Uncharacterized protein n=1 Tax=Stomoxys calcitrans TaxID=35570 RepID=A0A1I8PFP7_STOCA|nr:histone-lysine N-methyltransferase set1 [Stomoxys calcitrans]